MADRGCGTGGTLRLREGGEGGKQGVPVCADRNWKYTLITVETTPSDGGGGERRYAVLPKTETINGIAPDG